jgi:hypothetical protein
MATAEQIKSLIRSHLSDDDERFYTLALQVAAHEAQQGHGELAHDIKGIVDKARQTRGTNALLKFPQELAGMVLSEKAETPASALVLLDPLKKRIQRIIHEHRQQVKRMCCNVIVEPKVGADDRHFSSSPRTDRE